MCGPDGEDAAGSVKLESFFAFGDFMFGERFDERGGLAVEDGREVVEGEADTVVGDAVLGEVVSADAGVTVAGADFAAAFLGAGGALFGGEALKDAGAEHAHGLGAVFVLGGAFLAGGFDAGGEVDEADGGGGFVDFLSAGSGGAEE